jgi:hypothetical protein
MKQRYLQCTLRERTRNQSHESLVIQFFCFSCHEWTILYYHGPLTAKGRGEFLRLRLEDKGGVAYLNSADKLYGPDGIMDALRGSVEAIASDAKECSIVFPLLFPPSHMASPFRRIRGPGQPGWSVHDLHWRRFGRRKGRERMPSCSTP